MSQVFSTIGLETNTGIRDVGLMSGIPEVEDIQKSQLYKELVEDCGESEFITVAVKFFRYGEGEPEDAVAEKFFSCLDYELGYLRHFQTRTQARAAVFAYREAFYNFAGPLLKAGQNHCFLRRLTM